MNAFQYGRDKTRCEFSENVAFDKATNGQTEYKTRNVVNTQLNVTFEAPTLAMSLLKIVGEKLPLSQRQSLDKNTHSKLDLCEGGSFSPPAIFKSDIELSVYHISCYYICLFVRSSFCRRQHLPKIRTLFCLVHITEKVLFIQFNVGFTEVVPATVGGERGEGAYI